jgi:enoyl-CoA hydratase/carnithine racemase
MTFVTSEIRSGIATLTMNQPDTRNALSTPKQCNEFIRALQALTDNDEVRVAILTGAGAAFCAGGNVKDMQSHGGLMAGTPNEIAERYRRTLQRLASALHGVEVPIIAAVNGPAIGAGLDISCMCDIRIASENARFAETFVRLGLISGIGGAWFLPRAVGNARAAEMAFTGRVIDAATALEFGLVTEVLGEAELMPRAHVLAREIADNSGPALRYTKRLLRASERSDLATSLEATAAWQALAHLTPEHGESVDRYLEAQRLRRSAQT